MANDKKNINELVSDDDDPTAELEQLVLAETGLDNDADDLSEVGASTHGFENSDSSENQDRDAAITELRSDLKNRSETINRLQYDIEQLRARWTGLEKEITAREELTEKLKEWIEGPQIQVPALQQFFKDAFIFNWKTKLSALVLVTVAWMVLAFQQEVQINLTAPIRYDHLPAEFVVDDGSANAVGLTLAGRRNRINTLKQEDIQVHVNLSRFSPGDHLIKLSARNIDMPSGVRIGRITPQNISIVLKSVTSDQGPVSE